VKSGIPVCAIYGETTTSFIKDSSEEYLSYLGLPETAVNVYDNESKQFTKKGKKYKMSDIKLKMNQMCLHLTFNHYTCSKDINITQ